MRRLPRKYTIRNQRQAWTEEEHDRFVEALRLYKRNWADVTAYVGTRTVVQIRSHAQKHFMKLRREGLASQIPPRRNKSRRPRSRKRSAVRIENEDVSFDENVDDRKQAHMAKKRFKFEDDSADDTKSEGVKDEIDEIGEQLKEQLARSPNNRTFTGIQALLLLSRGG